MKPILFVDRKRQSSVTVFVCAQYEKGSLRLCVEPRCGGSALIESDFEEVKRYLADAWDSYRHLPGEQGLKVEVMPFSVITALESKNTPESAVAQ